ncbi:hypothetical protein BBF96_01115 [Anoxybacter fermentans]|uniref:EamA domain-containing protein n=1 Tax=Anoxybacter fermentans TaxID=1323375 RepID=A0A3Q9HQ47_9FIRM|nr:DMT family transporter [Anoxybacter fermentans]AZR72113.1 hypothetical protein BBF96_01115 [Anoxybacter fermentans]
MRNKTRGSIQIIISSIFFGALPLLTQIGYEGGANVVSILAIRFSIAAVLIWFYLWLTKVKIKVDLKQLFILAVVAIFGYGVMVFSYFLSLQYIPSSLAAMILFTYPVIVTYLSAILLNSPITKVKVIALVLVTIGVLLMSWGEVDFHPFGIFLAFIAALFYAIYIVYLGSSYTFQLEPRVLTAFIILFSAIFFMILGVIRGDLIFAISGFAWLAIIIMAIFSTIFAIMIFYSGVQKIGPALAAIISAVEPITVMILGVMILEEKVRFIQLLGSLLILSGVIYVQKCSSKPKIDWKARI